MPVCSMDQYLNYDELVSCLQQLAQGHPGFLQLESIGKSHCGRDIWLMIITQFDNGDHAHKPALWIDANIHSAELVSSMAALNFAQWILNHQDDPEVLRCLQTRTLYICPRVNPDGAEWALDPVPKIVRSSIRPYPFDELLKDGLNVEDVDGDGRILTMRIRDPHGHWKVSADDPRLLVQRDPAESGGEYYRLLPEGTIRHYDGFHMPAAVSYTHLTLPTNA